MPAKLENCRKCNGFLEGMEGAKVCLSCGHPLGIINAADALKSQLLERRAERPEFEKIEPLFSAASEHLAKGDLNNARAFARLGYRELQRIAAMERRPVRLRLERGARPPIRLQTESNELKRAAGSFETQLKNLGLPENHNLFYLLEGARSGISAGDFRSARAFLNHLEFGMGALTTPEEVAEKGPLRLRVTDAQRRKGALKLIPRRPIGEEIPDGLHILYQKLWTANLVLAHGGMETGAAPHLNNAAEHIKWGRPEEARAALERAAKIVKQKKSLLPDYLREMLEK